MSELDDLVARLKLDISDYEKNAKKAEKATDSLEKETNDLEKTNRSVGDSFDKLMTAFTGLNQGIQLVQTAFSTLKKGYDAVVTSTVAYAEEVRQLSRTIGSTPEDASKLIQAADDVKVEFDALQTSMNIAIRNGLEPTIEGMGRLSDEYVAIKDPIERAKFLLDNFGRSGADMAPLMELGADGIRKLGDAAQDTGMVLDNEALKATRDFEIAVDNLQDTWSGAKIQIGLEIIPIINEELNSIMTLIQASQMYQQVIDGITYAHEEGLMGAKQFKEVSNEAWRAFWLAEGVERGDDEGWLANMQEMVDRYGSKVNDASDATDDFGIKTKETADKIVEATTKYQAAADVLENKLANAYDEVTRAEKSWREGVAGDIKAEVDKKWENGELSIEGYQRALETLDATYGTGYTIAFQMEQQIPELVEKLLTDPQSFVDDAKAFEDYFMPLDESVKTARQNVESLKNDLNALERDYKITVEVIKNGSLPIYGAASGGGGNNNPVEVTEAGGGIVKAGQSVIWGEYGFEPFIPAEDGRILSHADAMNAIGGGGDGENSAMLSMILLELRDLPQGMKVAMQEAVALMGG
jgi:hypothetical protein